MPFRCHTNPSVPASINRTKKRDDIFIRRNLENAIEHIFNINQKRDDTHMVRLLPVSFYETSLKNADPEKYLVAYMLKLGLTLSEIESGLDNLAEHYEPAYYFVRIHAALLVDHRKMWYCTPESKSHMLGGQASNNIQYMPDRKTSDSK